ncbi:cell wall-associated NlpC family hydrolase [Curtobacterium luteum]|nr:NlpC/P60 family protein [Curtobacterium luteum]MBM7803519.1 cell wall-associated NlpC family hydrolase [Curtobacterium luteum]NUU50206.1 NlpC/P60 family protein [Curtobacterium luteum]
MKQPARTLTCTAVVAVVGIGLSIALAGPAQAAPSAPSWADVRAAKSNAAAAQRTVDELGTRLDALQTSADRASIVEQQAAQTYALAASQQQQAQADLDDLADQSKRAKATAEASAGQVAGLVVELARTGGGDLSTSMLVDARDSKDLLYRVGTMSHLSERSANVLAKAQADQNTVDSLAAQQRQATTALASATATTKSALADANDAASAAQGRLQREQDQQSQVLEQLAYLKGTSVATETAYWNAQQAKQAEAALASHTGGTTSSGQNASGGSADGGSASGGDTSGGSTSGGSGSGGTTTTNPGTSTNPSPSKPSPSNPTPSQPTPSKPKPTTPSPKPTTPTPTPTPTPVPSSPSKASGAIAFARAQLGDAYVLGGAGPNTWDCSGLVMMAYGSQGVATGGHNVVWQYNYFASIGRLVPLSQRQPGDILFYSSNGTASGGYHDSIYTGNGQMVEAARPGVGVVERAVWLPNQLLPYVARPTGSL